MVKFQQFSNPAVKKLYPDKWTALFYDDTGPNITALEDNDGNSNWAFYVRPKK